MFESRRPVPSPAALKVLTQLAYISSGTALGGAVLCAEERRRRLQIAQKLADHARAVRSALQSHPRHVSNITYTAGDAVEWGGDGDVQLSRRQRRVKRRRGQNENGMRDGSSGGPKSKTVEDTPNAAIDSPGGDSRQSRISRRRNSFARRRDIVSSLTRKRVVSPLFEVRKHISNNPSGPNSRSLWHARAPPGRDLDKGTTVYNSTSTLQDQYRASPHRGRIRSLKKRMTKPDLPDEQDQSVGHRSLTRDSSGDWYLHRDYPGLVTKDATSQASNYRALPSTRIVLAINRYLDYDDESGLAKALDLFFDREIRRTVPIQQAVSFASRLLYRTATNGDLRTSRSLCLWKLATGTFDEQDSEVLAENYEALAARSDQEEVNQFFGDLFATLSYVELIDLRSLVRDQVSVAASAVLLHPEEDIQAAVITILGDRNAHQPGSREILEKLCLRLLEEGEVTSSARCYAMLQERLLLGGFKFRDPRKLGQLAKTIFDAGLSSGNLSASACILRCRREWIDGDLIERININMFVQACNTRGMQRTLFDMFIGRATRIQTRVPIEKFLDDTSRYTLALVCARKPSCHGSFLNLYRTLPPSYREQLDASVHSESLRAIWRTTGDVAIVEARIRPQQSRAIQKKDERLLRDLDDMLLEVYIEAGRIDQALAIIQQMQKDTGVDYRLISHAAFLFASRDKWEHLELLLGHAQRAGVEMKPGPAPKSLPRLWDRVIHMFSLAHTAAQTWKFVNSLRERLQFIPTLATGRIVLEACVRTRSLDLAPAWLNHLEAIGVRVEFNSTLAAKMITAYWIMTKPKHKRLMWLCHFIQRHIPSFDPRAFKHVLMAAIGYDLRNSSEQDVRIGGKNPPEHAVARLDLLKKLELRVPIPGWTGPKGDRHLIFRKGGGLFANEVNPFQGKDINRAPGMPNEELTAPATVDDTSSASDIHSLAEATLPSTAEKLQATQYKPFDKEGASPKVGMADESLEPTKWGLPQTDLVHVGAEDTATSKFSEPIEKDAMSEQQYQAMIAELNVDDVDHLDADKEDSRREPQQQMQLAGGDVSTHDDQNVLNEQDLTFEDLHTTDDEPADLLTTDLDPSSDVSFDSKLSVEQEMVKHLSLCQYEKVLELYQDSRDQAGLPLSVRTLEIAVQASLKLHGGETGPAQELLSHAATAGTNVAGAKGPLIIQQMKRMDERDKHNANHLRATVIDYYRANDENGFPVSHHVAVTAAHLLIRHRRPHLGVNLLTAVYKSEWATRRPLKTPALQVFLEGYRRMLSVDGVKWVVDQMLSRNLRITAPFMRELKRTYGFNPNRNEKFAVHFRHPKDRKVVFKLAQICYDRRLRQIDEDFRFGLELEATIKQCAQQQGLEVTGGANSGFKALHAPSSPSSKDSEFASRRQSGVRIPAALKAGNLIPARFVPFGKKSDDSVEYAPDVELNSREGAVAGDSVADAQGASVTQGGPAVLRLCGA